MANIILVISILSSSTSAISSLFGYTYITGNFSKIPRPKPNYRETSREIEEFISSIKYHPNRKNETDSFKKQNRELVEGFNFKVVWELLDEIDKSKEEFSFANKLREFFYCEKNFIKRTQVILEEKPEDSDLFFISEERIKRKLDTKDPKKIIESCKKIFGNDLLVNGPISNFEIREKYHFYMRELKGSIKVREHFKKLIDLAFQKKLADEQTGAEIFETDSLIPKINRYRDMLVHMQIANNENVSYTIEEFIEHFKAYLEGQDYERETKERIDKEWLKTIPEYEERIQKNYPSAIDDDYDRKVDLDKIYKFDDI